MTKMANSRMLTVEQGPVVKLGLGRYGTSSGKGRHGISSGTLVFQTITFLTFFMASCATPVLHG